MLGYQLGDLHAGGASATGTVTIVHAQQTGALQMHVQWTYQGFDATKNILFLVYLDGELVRRLPGNHRSANIIVPNNDPHQINIVPIRHYGDPLEEMYGAAITSRAHLRWVRETGTLSAYEIYHSTDNITYTLDGTITKPSLQTKIDNVASGAQIEISGSYSGPVTNRLYTLTITNAAEDEAELTNDNNADMATVSYNLDHPATLFAGVQATIRGVPVNGDAISFLVGIQPEYNSTVLADGLHYFKVKSIDAADNASSLSSAITVVITRPPLPLTEINYRWDFTDPNWTLTIAGNIQTDGQWVHVYSNYDGTTLHGEILSFTPFMSVGPFLTGLQDITLLLTDNGTLPAGTYQFIARTAVGDIGTIDDGTSVLYSVEVPYIPATLPAVIDLTAIATTGGGVLLSWYSLIECNGWHISGVGTPQTYTLTGVESAGNLFGYAKSFTGVECGVEGLKTITVKSSDGGRFGTPSVVTVTTDATAPSAPTMIDAIPW